MLNFIIPIVFFCPIIPNENNSCDGTTAIFHRELEATMTPIDCLLKGTSYATNYISSFEEEHTNKKLQYRIVCKGSQQKT